jgi:hypothetical protein
VWRWRFLWPQRWGGFVLFAMHLMKKPLLRGLMFVHALAAVVAFVLLLVSLLRG